MVHWKTWVGGELPLLKRLRTIFCYLKVMAFRKVTLFRFFDSCFLKLFSKTNFPILRFCVEPKEQVLENSPAYAAVLSF